MSAVPAIPPVPSEPAARAPRRNPLEINPLWVKGLRSRCRLKHLLTWGVIWITLATFVFLITYTTLIEQSEATRADAAKAALPGILIIQAIILMIFGTGAVATGVSQERDEGLLDYVRMTPMTPTAKLVGYLFGLPAREYVLFAFTMPLVLLIVALSGFSLLTLGHFYLVFFTSVLVYHMTALVVGTVAPRPRLASMTSMGIVVVLYFALPNLSRMGITFFEFLTIRPTFFGLIQQELPESLRAQAESSGIDTFRPVPFFEGVVQPTAFTLLVQGFLIAVMFSIVHRKWRDQANHLFSKIGGLLSFTGVLVFTVGSVWSVIAQEDAYARLFAPLEEYTEHGRFPETLFILLMTGLMIVSAAFVFLVCSITPSRSRTLIGLRRADKLGLRGIHPAADAASSLPVTLVMIALTLGAGVMLMRLTQHHADYYLAGPTLAATLPLVLLIISIALFVQGVAESTSLRVFGVAAFLVWMIPCFAMIILFAAFERFEEGLYVGQPFPPASVGFAIAWMLESTTPHPEYAGQTRFLFPGEDMIHHPASIAWTGAALYTTAAVGAQILRHRRRRALQVPPLGFMSESMARASGPCAVVPARTAPNARK